MTEPDNKQAPPEQKKSEPLFSLQTEKQGDVLLIKLNGRLTSARSIQLEEEVARHLRHGEKQIILDFGGLQQISSPGLRVVLLAAQKLHAAGGKLMLTNLGGNVKEVFDISGFTSWMFSEKGWIQKS